MVSSGALHSDLAMHELFALQLSIVTVFDFSQFRQYDGMICFLHRASRISGSARPARQAQGLWHRQKRVRCGDVSCFDAETGNEASLARTGGTCGRAG